MSLFSDTYHQIEHTAEFSLREKGSKFLAYSFLISQEQDVKAHLMALKSQFPDATHHCYAYVIGQDSQSQRANDDGEPANSAGRPILRAIISAELTNVLVVVVRYFGGTLLGIPGLIQAYGESATGVLLLSGKVQKMQEETFVISAEFQHEQEIHRLLNSVDARILDRTYDSGVTYKVAVRKLHVIQFERAAKEAYLLKVGVS